MTNIKELIPAIAVHPGEHILDELIAHNYTQASFAKLVGMKKSQLNEIIKGKRDLNADLAILLEAALGLEASYWLSLQSQFNVDVARIDKKARERVMAMRVLEGSSNYIAYKFLNKQKVVSGDPITDIPILSTIYGIENLGQIQTVYEDAQFARFRKSGKLSVDTVNLVGWVKYSEYNAKSVVVRPFIKDGWDSLKKELRTLLYKNKEVQESAQILLADYGIKLLYQEKAVKTPIDGIAFWSNDNPTIAMTLRHKRLDNFAFTLFHELGHVFLHLKNDKSKGVIDIKGDHRDFKKSHEEIEADNFAANSLIPVEDWKNFISKTPITEKMIYEFADSINMNASIILGRICFEMKRYNIKTSINHSIK